MTDINKRALSWDEAADLLQSSNSAEVRKNALMGLANYVADKRGLDRARVQHMLLRVDVLEVDAADAYHIASREDWFISFCDALDVLAPIDALELFEHENPARLLQRIDTTAYLADPNTLLSSIQDLEQITQSVIRNLQANREHLMVTGFPRFAFPQAPLLEHLLVRMYHLKTPRGIAHVGRPGERVEREYAWSQPPLSETRESGAEIHSMEEWVDLLRRVWEAVNRDPMVLSGHIEPWDQFGLIIGGDYQHAAYRGDFNAEEISRIEADRGRFLDLKIHVLEELLRAIHRRDGATLWNQCLLLLTRTFTAADVDFYARIDERYSSAARENWEGHENPGTETAGGLSDLLYVVGCYEEELRLHRLTKTCTALGAFYNESPGQNLTVANYFEATQRHDRALLDQALDLFLSFQSRDGTFWTEYQARVSDALQYEFTGIATIHVPVKRRHIRDLEEYALRIVTLANTELERSGSLPQISISLGPGVKPSTPADSRFVESGTGWLLQYRGGETTWIKDSRGAFYVHAVLAGGPRGIRAEVLESEYDSVHEGRKRPRESRDPKLSREAVFRCITYFLSHFSTSNRDLKDHLTEAILGKEARRDPDIFRYLPPDEILWQVD